MQYVIALVLALVLNACANLMIKFSVRRPEGAAQSFLQAVFSNRVLILALVCFATNIIFYRYALKDIRLSIAYPVMVGGGFAIIALVAWKSLGETLSPAQWIGVGLIMAGITLVAGGMQPVAAAQAIK